jgi:hypothetical protein
MMLMYKMLMMTFNKINRTLVGADVSRPPPIYRPSVGFLNSSLNVLYDIIGHYWRIT